MKNGSKSATRGTVTRRVAVLLGCVAAGCTSDATDGTPFDGGDARSVEIGFDATDTGTDRLAVDLSDDDPRPVDAGPRCAPGQQGTCACGIMVAVYTCPASGVPPEPCPCGEDLDGAVRDAGAADVLRVDVTDDRPAPTDAAADAGADTGVCAVGLGDCDGNPANGCETDTRTSATNCGGCGRACVPGDPCAAGVCVRNPCLEGYGNCDGLAANGCETNTRFSAAHCGTCGHACGAGQRCESSACVAATDAGADVPSD
jgi:hypothetical protein